MTNTQRHAERELEILFKSTPDAIVKPFKKEILDICEAFGKSGQSGGSAPYIARALSETIRKLCLQETIAPITGEEHEWNDVSARGDGRDTYQNNRQSAIFKEGKEGKPYYLDAIIWRGQYDWDKGTDKWNDTYSGSASYNGETFLSRQHIKKFPFEPITFYIDVVREILPEDWTEEPFIEWDYYEGEGENKVRKTEKYRNIIKDPEQLKEVFEYYNKFE